MGNGHHLHGRIVQAQQEQMLDELQKAADLSGDSPLYMAQVGVSLALAGERKEALRVVRELQAISSKRYVSAYGVAQIYAALNDKEQTYKWLDTAYRDRAVWMSSSTVAATARLRKRARISSVLGGP